MSNSMIEEFLKNKGVTKCPDYDPAGNRSFELRSRSFQSREYNQQNNIVQATQLDGTIKSTKKQLEVGALENVKQINVDYKNADLVGFVWKDRLVTKIEYARTAKGNIVEVCVFSDGGVVRCSKIRQAKNYLLSTER